MDDKQVNSPFYVLKKFKNYKKVFFLFFILIVIPILFLKSFLIHTTYLPTISFGITTVLYSAMFLFINSFVVLYGVSFGKDFSFSQVLKFIPSISPTIILPTIIFATLIVLAKSFFIIAPFLVFAFIPIVSIVPLYNKNVSLNEIIDINKQFVKTSMGKTLIKNTFILSFISIIVIFFLKNFFLGFFSFFEQRLPFSIYHILTSLLYAIAFFIVYITIVNTYSIYRFIIPDKLYDISKSIIEDTKLSKRKRTNFSPKRHSHNKKAQKPDIFDFEKKEQKFKKKKERNRFTEDDGFNRFEDTKF